LRIVRRVALVLLAVVVLAGVPLASLMLPYRGFSGETFVKFERGAGTPAMAWALQEAGVIRFPWQFWLARAMNPDVKLVAGEYRFADAASVREVFDRIARGDVYYFDFNVPEGSNIFDIARLAEAAGVAPAQEFLEAAGNPALVKDLDPAAKTLEGYLFPATYRLSHSTTAAELCRMMTARFRLAWKKLGWEANPHDVVTLASLVEKETGLAEERPLIAGVFANRLKLRMALDCDPTTIYAALLENRYRGAIHKSDLKSGNPYNTYQNAGLPPGPIANPGAEALAAALMPTETDYLYFVAKPGGGGHQFSKSLAEHDKAVSAYRHGKGKGG
jgi:peptidoglycan lytic transglycosylase G